MSFLRSGCARSRFPLFSDGVFYFLRLCGGRGVMMAGKRVSFSALVVVPVFSTTEGLPWAIGGSVFPDALFLTMFLGERSQIPLRDHLSFPLFRVERGPAFPDSRAATPFFEICDAFPFSWRFFFLLELGSFLPLRGPPPPFFCGSKEVIQFRTCFFE